MSSVKPNFKLTDCPALCKPNCKIRDPTKVERILNELINNGVNRIQFISDFDYTLTKQRLDNGDPVLSTLTILENCPSVPDSYKIESNRLDSIYGPIENDPNLSINQKLQHMIDWWTKCSELLHDFSIDPIELDNVTNKYIHTLRDGITDLFQDLNKNNIPLLILSAGIGDTIESILRQTKILLSNVKIISNFLEYKNGILNGFNIEKMIHVFNKNDTVIVGIDYYESVKERDNIILLGDSLGDANMANGLPNTSQILKIGFLYLYIEQNLPNYMDAYDIVLVDDQTMDVPRSILSLILQNTTCS